MIEIIKSKTFDEWIGGLKDRAAAFRIHARLSRVSQGNFGDHKGIGDGISELRFNFGAGYRVYYKQYGSVVVLLLAGGDKSTQVNDIKKALEIAAKWSEQP